MTLPAYAEELKRLCDVYAANLKPKNRVAILNHIHDNLDRILRDAEIAEAAREYARLRNIRDADPQPPPHTIAMCNAHDAVLALIAKETP